MHLYYQLFNVINQYLLHIQYYTTFINFFKNVFPIIYILNIL